MVWLSGLNNSTFYGVLCLRDSTVSCWWCERPKTKPHVSERALSGRVPVRRDRVQRRDAPILYDIRYEVREERESLACVEQQCCVFALGVWTVRTLFYENRATPHTTYYTSTQINPNYRETY